MKRILISGVTAMVLLGVVGCGGSGIEEGMPAEEGKGVPLDPKMTDMTGRSFKEAGKAEQKAADVRNNPTPEATEKK